MTELTKKVDSAMARFDRVTAQLDSRSGIVRDARNRELKRLNQGLVSTLIKIGIVVGVISVLTISHAETSRKSTGTTGYPQVR